MKASPYFAVTVAILVAQHCEGGVLDWFRSKSPEEKLSDCLAEKCAGVSLNFDDDIAGQASFFLVPDRFFDAENLQSVCEKHSAARVCKAECSDEDQVTGANDLIFKILNTVCNGRAAFESVTPCLRKAAPTASECETADRCGTFNSVAEKMSTASDRAKNGQMSAETLITTIQNDICNFMSCIKRCQTRAIRLACDAADVDKAARVVNKDGVEAYFDALRRMLPEQVRTFPSDCANRQAERGSVEWEENLPKFPDGAEVSQFKEGTVKGSMSRREAIVDSVLAAAQLSDAGDGKKQLPSSGLNFIFVDMVLYKFWRPGMELTPGGMKTCTVEIKEDDAKLGKVVFDSGKRATHLTWTCLDRCCGLECCSVIDGTARLMKKKKRMLRNVNDDFYEQEQNNDDTEVQYFL